MRAKIAAPSPDSIQIDPTVIKSVDQEMMNMIEATMRKKFADPEIMAEMQKKVMSEHMKENHIQDTIQSKIKDNTLNSVKKDVKETVRETIAK